MSTLDINAVALRFGATVALNNISLRINEGELFFLLGPSGCGKTTLLRVIAGLAVPDAGSVRFRETDLLALPVEKRNIGMVFQNYSLWPHMSVFDNVAYGLRMRGTGAEAITTKVQNALSLVDMASLSGRKPGELSGGQQQRVALARALVYEPAILLLDEPLSNLDARLRKDMRREIRQLHQRLGITMVYVTHDQEEAASMAQRVALLRDATLLQIGTPEQLYHEPSSVYAAEFFGRANTLYGRLVSVTDDAVQLRCGEITLVATRPAAVLEPETEVAVVFRPEDLRIGTAAPANHLQAVVRDREFNGAVETYSIELPGGARVLLQDISRENSRLAINETVGISIDPADIRILPGEAAS